MNIKGFFSNWIVRNLLLAALAVLLFVLVANLFLSLVTQHGKEIIVPDFTNLTVQEASRVAAESRSLSRIPCTSSASSPVPSICRPRRRAST